MIHRVLDYVGYRCINLSEHLKGHDAMANEWKLYGNEPEIARMEYPLDGNSLIVDVGGYNGEWAQEMYARYSCHIDIYEPHPKYAERAMQRFGKSNKVRVYPIALMDFDGDWVLSNDEIYSIVGKGNCNIKVSKASDVFKSQYHWIDLLKINTEGGEYFILPDIINSGYDMTRIQNIQIQFHKCREDSEEKRKEIWGMLERTHELVWRYGWLYESWRLK